MLAVTHTIPENFQRCVTTHLTRVQPDLVRARSQWSSYCRRLRKLGCRVHVLEGNSHLPDAPFVEDTGVVVENVFISTLMKAPTRRSETELVASYFAETHEVVRLRPPAFLDGGDVLRVGRTFFVGLSGRTNRAGFSQFQNIVHPLGYKVTPVTVSGCLHLKTAVTALDAETLLLNPQWVDAGTFSNFRVLKVPDVEPFSANVLKVHSRIIAATGYPRRDDVLYQAGFEFSLLEISELEKAEAGLTCLSILVGS